MVRIHTIDGWKGFLNDPFLDGSFEISLGLRLVRQLFVEITDMGLPVATELLSTLSPLYLTELGSVCFIGSQTAESSVHRELASRVQCPVGFVNRSRPDPRVIIEVAKAVSTEHNYLSVTPEAVYHWPFEDIASAAVRQRRDKHNH
jgi:3-deoxy-7-phosphoheptulonate synthase